MNDDLLNSQYWRWYLSHRPLNLEDHELLRREALEILVASVNAGDVTCLDGIESPLSKRIRARHQCDDLEMNSNWIGTSQTWVCPCCGRDKFQVSRIGRQGQILAKLVVHHDHMGEVLKSAFHAAFETAGTDVVQANGRRLVERIGTAFAAYEEVLVCEDCNNADAEAKKLAVAPASFSFSIGQIQRFIRGRHHAPHEVVEAMAVQVWRAAKPAYELRMKLIHDVARAAATDNHWYEPYAYTMKPIPVLGERPMDYVILEWTSTSALCSALGPKPQAKIRNLSRWRQTSPKRGRDLPPNFLAMLLSDESRAHLWQSVADDWHCPICRRSKQETVYVKDTKIVFSRNSNPARYWQNAPTICGHCSAVLMSLKWEAVDSAGIDRMNSYSIVTPEELSGIIAPRPHSSHSIRAAEAAALVATAIRRLMQNIET